MERLLLGGALVLLMSLLFFMLRNILFGPLPRTDRKWVRLAQYAGRAGFPLVLAFFGIYLVLQAL